MNKLRVVAIVLLLVAAACGEATEVGADVDVGTTEQGTGRLGEVKIPEDDGGSSGESLALGEKEDESDQQEAGTQAQADEQEQEQQIQQQREQAAYAFAITQSGYNPHFIRIFAGGTVKVTNQFNKAASVTADKGEFDSGLLQPGDTWVGGPFTRVGKFNFHDEERPYVVGTLEVVPK